MCVHACVWACARLFHLALHIFVKVVCWTMADGWFGGWRMTCRRAHSLLLHQHGHTHTHAPNPSTHTHTQNPSTSPTKPLDSPGLVEKGEHQGGVELWTEPRVSPPQVVCFYRVRPDWGQCVFLSKGKAGKPVALKKRGLMGNQYKMRQGSRRAFHCTPIHYVHFSMVDDKRI